MNKSNDLKTLKERQEYWTAKLANLPTWEDRYKEIIVLGKVLLDLDESLRTEESKVKGCQSQVWLVPEVIGQGANKRLDFRGDSDAIIVRGIVAIILMIFLNL